MKTIQHFTLALTLLITTQTALADGLPIDSSRERIVVPHSFLKISNSQLEEIIAIGTFTFSSDQWTKIRSLRAACPKRIETVYPRDWNDCTCDSEGGPYVIQWDHDTIAVVLPTIRDDPAAELINRLADSDGVFLSMDVRGQFYHRGILIPYQKLLKAIEVKAEPNKNNITSSAPSVSIDIPLELSSESPTLKTRLTELRLKLESFGWKVWVH